MKKLLLTTTILTLMNVSLASAAVEQDITSGGVVEPKASQSELGSEIEMIGKDFNLMSVQEAFDKSSNTENVKVYDYAINKTFAIRMRVNMATMIVLPEWEKIKAFSLADDLFFSVTNFDVEGMLNKLVLQSNIAGVDTNLVVIGESGNIYNMYLRNDSVDSPKVPHFTVYIKGVQPLSYKMEKETDLIEKSAKKPPSSYMPAKLAGLDSESLERARADYLSTLADSDEVDLNYEITGDFEIAPRAVYSRHGWTFFDFRETLPSDRLPVVYKVIDGYDSVINTRMENGFLIAESLSTEGWTLRNGDSVICVRKSE